MEELKNLLNYLYLEGELSTPQIAGQFGVAQYTIWEWLAKFNISRRAISETNSGRHNPMSGRRGVDTPNYGKRGKDATNWRGGKYKTNDGYIRTTSNAHPNADGCGYVLEHRLVMEKEIGRYLTKEETVHHENEIKDDNRLENLKLFKDNPEHLNFHKSIKETDNE